MTDDLLRTRDETLSDLYRTEGSDPLSRSDTLGMQTSWSEPPLTRDQHAQPPGPANIDLSNARSEAGAPIRDIRDLAPSSIITVGGFETTVEAALAVGAITRDPATGLLRAASGTPDAASDEQALADAMRREQEAQEEEPESAPTRLDDDSEGILAHAYATAPDAAVVAAASIIENNGELSQHQVEQLASRLGLEPSEVARRAAHVGAAFEAEAANVSARDLGTSAALAAEALADARQKQPDALKAAAQNHVNTGRADYRAIVIDYLADLGTKDPSRILDAEPVPGRHVRWDGSAKTVMVDLDNGMSLTWEQAVRMRLIGMK